MQDEFRSKKLDDGRVQIVLTVEANTAKQLYSQYVEGAFKVTTTYSTIRDSQLSSTDEDKQFEDKSPSLKPSVPKLNWRLKDLSSRERIIVEILGNYPLDKPFPSSHQLVELVDWSEYKKEGSPDAASRASSIRAVISKLDKKGLTVKRGQRNELERFWNTEGKSLAEEAMRNLEARHGFHGSM